MKPMPEGLLGDELRDRAEQELELRQPPGSGEDGDSRRLLHELQVHQIELEMQNEALREAQHELIRHQDHLEQLVAERTDQVRRLAADATYAEERERQNLARDLHDGLGQLLHVVRINLGLLGKSDLPAEAQKLLAQTHGLIADASRQVRSLTSQLSPPTLTTLGLPATLQWLCGEIQQIYGLVVHCQADLPLAGVSSAQSAILFRAARELLINVAKHSAGTSASLVLAREETRLTMTVEDSGGGTLVLDEALAGTKGFGLASIRERVFFLGGTMNIYLPASGGVRIALNIPLAEPGAVP